MTTHPAKRWHEAVDARTWCADATPCKRAPVGELRSREPPPCAALARARLANATGEKKDPRGPD